MAVGLVGSPGMGRGGFLNWFEDKVRARLDQSITSRMMIAGHEIVAEARRLCPVDTGRLRDSIGFTYDQSTKTLRVHADAPYSLFVEFGTRYMAAQPFLRPAINAADRAFGVSHVIEFATTPHLKGTDRKPNAAVVAHNFRSYARHNVGHTAKAKVRIRRGKWNGPRRPWSGQWDGSPSPVGPE